ncbi:MAG: hypothetical protein P4M13_10150 [Alphaproteobacteria bacterium]|nr:hypothetical protein [Alphaproteobacteria bacterium]
MSTSLQENSALTSGGKGLGDPWDVAFEFAMTLNAVREQETARKKAVQDIPLYRPNLSKVFANILQKADVLQK